jgi:formylglycine-generating enzyme required for sulfatase activity
MTMATSAFLVTTGMGQSLVITSFSGNGVVQWTYPTNGLAGYRIEWAANLATGKWTDLESGLRSLAPTGAIMAAEVPMFYRVNAMAPPPGNMVYIPPGTFRMGDTFAEGNGDELPVHNVFVSGFYMDRY